MTTAHTIRFGPLLLLHELKEISGAIVDVREDARVIHVDIFRARNIMMHDVFRGGGRRQGKKFLNQGRGRKHRMASLALKSRDHKHRILLSIFKSLLQLPHRLFADRGGIHWCEQKSLDARRNRSQPRLK